MRDRVFIFVKYAKLIKAFQIAPTVKTNDLVTLTDLYAKIALRDFFASGAILYYKNIQNLCIHYLAFFLMSLV